MESMSAQKQAAETISPQSHRIGAPESTSLLPRFAADNMAKQVPFSIPQSSYQKVIPTPSAPPAQQPPNDWKEAIDPATQLRYWYNTLTKATTWDMPMELRTNEIPLPTTPPPLQQMYLREQEQQRLDAAGHIVHAEMLQGQLVHQPAHIKVTYDKETPEAMLCIVFSCFILSCCIEHQPQESAKEVLLQGLDKYKIKQGGELHFDCQPGRQIIEAGNGSGVMGWLANAIGLGADFNAFGMVPFEAVAGEVSEFRITMKMTGCCVFMEHKPVIFHSKQNNVPIGENMHR